MVERKSRRESTEEEGTDALTGFRLHQSEAMRENNQRRKPHCLRTEEGVDVPVSWRDIAPTGEIKNGQKVYRLKGTDTEGFKIHKLELDEEQAKRVDILLEWISSVDVPSDPKSGLETLTDAWKK